MSEGSEAEALQRSYQIHEFPTLLVVDGEGRELDRYLGFLDGPALLKELERILRGEGTLPALAAAAKQAPDDLAAQQAYATRLLKSDAKAAEGVFTALLPRLAARPEEAVKARLAIAKAAALAGDEDRSLELTRKVAVEWVGVTAANEALLEVVQRLAYEKRNPLAALETVIEARKAASDRGQPFLSPAVETQLVTILLETAAEAFEKAVEADEAGGGGAVDIALAGAGARLDPARAAEIGKKALEKHPDDPKLLVAVASLLLDTGDVDDALPLAVKALAKASEDDEKERLEELVAKIQAVQALRKAREDKAAGK